MIVRTLLPLIVALTCVMSSPCRADDTGRAARPAGQVTDDESVAVPPNMQAAEADDMAVGPKAAPERKSPLVHRTSDPPPRFQIRR